MARGDGAGALDATGAKMLVFGGDKAVAVCGDIPAHTNASDTWILDVGGCAWRAVAAGAGPGARARHAAVLDHDKNRALIFGGRTRAGTSGPYTLMNDVWSFDFATEAWSKVAATGALPSARSNAAAVLDHGKLIVFGGSTSTDGLQFIPQNDTFSLDLATNVWSAVASTSTKPPARLFHAMAVDEASRVAYLFSGGGANAFMGPFFTDVWALDLAAQTWSQVTTTGDAPRGRINHGMVYDASRKRLVTFAGHDDGPLGNGNDLFALDLTASPAAWTNLSKGDVPNKAPNGQCGFPPDFTTIDKAAPERRSAFVFAPRVDGSGFMVFGGKSDCGVLSDAWYWSASSLRWTTLKATPVGLSCLRTSTTCSGLCG